MRFAAVTASLGLLATGGACLYEVPDYAQDSAADGGAPDTLATDAGNCLNCPGPGFHCSSTGECGGFFATCDEMHKARNTLPSGLYQFNGPKGPYFAYCDMTLDNGGWTLVGRSVVFAVPTAFGWLKPIGDPSQDKAPYAFDIANYTGSPKEALVGLYSTFKVWSSPVYKITLPANFPAAFTTTSIAVKGSAIVPPACGPTLAPSLGYVGFTSNANAFYFDATGGANATLGLGYAGFKSAGGPDAGLSCDVMNGKQGQIFIR